MPLFFWPQKLLYFGQLVMSMVQTLMNWWEFFHEVRAQGGAIGSCGWSQGVGCPVGEPSWRFWWGLMLGNSLVRLAAVIPVAKPQIWGLCVRYVRRKKCSSPKSQVLLGMVGKVVLLNHRFVFGALVCQAATAALATSMKKLSISGNARHISRSFCKTQEIHETDLRLYNSHSDNCSKFAGFAFRCVLQEISGLLSFHPGHIMQVSWMTIKAFFCYLSCLFWMFFPGSWGQCHAGARPQHDLSDPTDESLELKSWLLWLVPTSWNAFDPWQFPESVKLPTKNSHSTTRFGLHDKGSKSFLGKCRFFAITTRFVHAGKNWARETPPRGCFVQDDGIRGVTGISCQRLGGRTAKANQNQNKVTLGGVKQHDGKAASSPIWCW